jgi:hypothetical protein
MDRARFHEARRSRAAAAIAAGAQAGLWFLPFLAGLAAGAASRYRRAIYRSRLSRPSLASPLPAPRKTYERRSKLDPFKHTIDAMLLLIRKQQNKRHGPRSGSMTGPVSDTI